MPPCADSRNTRHTTPFSLSMPTLTPSTRWPCYCRSYCCVLGQSSGRATEHSLHCSCCRATYELRNYYKKIWYDEYHTFERAPDPSTTAARNILRYTVQETANSSAWNHIVKFQRRVRDGRRSRKLLSLCHTYGSAPRSPYLPCQIMN